MSARLLGKSVHLLPLLPYLLAIPTAPMAFAAPTDCIESGTDGRQLCSRKYPTPLSVQLCDEAAAFVSRDAAMCRALGGTPAGAGNCIDQTVPVTEENLADLSIRFAQELRLNKESCGISSDTGWNATYTSNFCFNANGAVFEDGYLIGDFRRFTVACSGGGGEVLSARKGRSLECPIGFVEHLVVRAGVFVDACTRPLETCDTCDGAGGGAIGGNRGVGGTVGNPVTPATGVKILTETDYRHPQGLAFTRNYHSFRFFKPFTTPPDVAPVNQLGMMWRSNYDKRVVPIGVNDVYALTYPNGELQYFDGGGNEILNLHGAGGRLLIVPDGYIYLGSGNTEFYRT